MRKLLILPVLLLAATVLPAQQAPLFSQFFQQKNLSNPAAAGSQGWPTVALLHRQQWAGLDGAPATQALSFHTPAFADRVGLGLTLLNDRIGFSNATFLNGAYAYRMKFGENTLALGLQATYQHQRTDWAAARTIGRADDPDATGDDLVPVFNLGLGGYFEGRNFFVGWAVPQVLEKGFSKRNEGFATDGTGSVRHLLLHGGLVTDLTPGLKMRPALAARLVPAAPPSLEAHLSFGLVPFSQSEVAQPRLWAGATLRWSQSEVPAFGDALIATCQYRLSDRLLAGLAYDLSLGELQRASSGTYELLVEYVFSKKESVVKRPRYF